MSSILLVIYLLSLVAGITLWKGHAVGRTISIIVQAIQLPKLISPPLIFLFSFGFDLYLYWITGQMASILKFEVKALAFHQLYIKVPNAPFGIGVSIIAVVFLILLARARPSMPISPDVSLPRQ